MSKTKSIVLSITFLLSHLCFAQNVKEEQTLTAILEIVENQFECNFSYADSTVQNIQMEFDPIEFNSLKKTLKFLQQKTKLTFTLQKDNFITISPSRNKKFICGFLIDTETDEPIEDATITLGDQISISDENGYFNFSENKHAPVLAIHHLGYKRVQYLLNQLDTTSCENLYLIPKIEQIKEIVVKNYLTKGIQKTVKGSYTIDYNKFDMLPGLVEPDVLLTLQAFPGIQSIDESVSNINIRGGTHHENLLLWDGMKMYQSGHFFGLISAFNPHLTKNAVLIKNGTDAIFSEGISGTILMETSNSVNNEFKTEIGLNLINADAMIDIPTSKNSSLQLSARKSINNLIETPTYKQYYDKAFQDSEILNDNENVIKSDDEFSFYDVNVRWLYEISPYDKIRVNFLNFDNNLLFFENAFVDGIEESKESSAAQRNIAGGINYDRSWNDQFSSSIQVYATKYSLESINHDIINNQRLIQENEVLEGAINLETTFKLSERFSFYNGYHYQETGVTNIQDVDNPLFQSKIKQVIRSHGLSTQIGFQSDNYNTNVRLGLRANYLEKFSTFLFEPRISLSQQIIENLTFQFLGEMKHQTASQIIDFQDDFLGIENRRWILANDDEFPILKSYQGSLGLFYTNNGWLISAEGYIKNVEGITTKSQGFQNQYQYINDTGKYDVYGADFLIRKRFRSINNSISYSYVNNEYTFEHLSIGSFPSNFDINHNISFASTYSIKKFNFSTGVNWHSGKPTTKPVEGNEIVDGEINFETANSSRLDDYMRVDLSAQYKFDISNKVKGSTAVSVWNLFNQENITNTYYKIDDTEVIEVNQNSLGITPNVSFRVSF